MVRVSGTTYTSKKKFTLMTARRVPETIRVEVAETAAV